jgi:hypothetical protein
MEITVAWMVHRPTEATVIGKTKSWRARAAGAVVIAFAALGFAPAVAGAADPVYGVSTASPLKAKDLQELADGGVQALRLEISWNATKGKGGALNWGRTDARLEAAADQGIDVVPYLTGTPKWAKGCKKKSCKAPDQLTPANDAWLRFVDGAVERYGPGGILSKPVATWQVWDTANRGSPKGYDQLLGATFRTINLADPGAKVLTGALSFASGKGMTSPTKLLKRLMNPKVNQTFSAVGVSPQSRSVGKVKKQVKSIRKVLDKAGRKGTEIWVTPVGWASDKRSSKALSVGKAGQKQRLSQAMKSLRSGLGVGGVFWSRWRDGGGGCKWCRHSGLLSKKGKAKPAWGAYKKFLKTLVTNPPPPPELDPFFRGVVPDGWVNSTDAFLMKAAGVGAVRFIINWQQVTGSGGFNWTKTDDEFKELAEQGIEPLPQLFGNPNLVSNTVDSDGNPRQDVMNQWQAFVAATVARYKPGGKFWTDHPELDPHPPHVWQVYNEQNIPAFWPGGPSPNKYAGFLHGTAEMIRLVDPTAKIMLGGMHGDPAMNGTPSYDFLRLLYNREAFKGWDDFDIVAVHPYGFSTNEITTEIDKVRQEMVVAHDSASQIWVSEMGWASTGDGNPSTNLWWERTPQQQAQMLTAAWNLMIAKRDDWNLGGVFWYAWRDPLGDPCTFCGTAGLLQHNFASKPSFNAFKQITAASHPG